MPCLPNTSNAKDFIPIIGTIVVVLLFIIQRILEYSLRKKEISKSWYLKVLLEPNIDKISCFFSDAQKSFKESAELLCDSGQLPHDGFLKLQTTKNGEFQSLKRTFECDVILTIQATYPNLASELSLLLMEIEDLFTSSLDKEDNRTKHGISNFQNKMSEKKASLLKLLYTPLKN